MLHTTEYLEGNPMQGKMVPRLIGFVSEAELEFFELFCTVDKVGVRKAMKALVRPIREIADAIQRQDPKWLTSLPGIGPATAEQIVATLRRKVTKFALMAPPKDDGSPAAPPDVDGSVIADAYRRSAKCRPQPARGPRTPRSGARQGQEIRQCPRSLAGDL